MVEYISSDFRQLRRKFQHERNLSLLENDKNKFYTSKRKIFYLQYFSIVIFSIVIIYISRLLSFTM